MYPLFTVLSKKTTLIEPYPSPWYVDGVVPSAPLTTDKYSVSPVVFVYVIISPNITNWPEPSRISVKLFNLIVVWVGVVISWVKYLIVKLLTSELFDICLNILLDVCVEPDNEP